MCTFAAYAPLPFAFAHLGWEAGVIFLALAGIVTWYTSLLLASLHSHDGKRHTRYCDLAGSIYGATFPLPAPRNTSLLEAGVKLYHLHRHCCCKITSATRSCQPQKEYACVKVLTTQGRYWCRQERVLGSDLLPATGLHWQQPDHPDCSRPVHEGVLLSPSPQNFPFLSSETSHFFSEKPYNVS